MVIKSFEEMLCWQKSQELAIFIYKNFNQLKDFSFRDQICRAAVSISNNEAEGFDRKSSKEFIYFLHISRGSNSEVKSMLYLAKELSSLQDDVFQKAILLCDENGKLINGLINYLNKYKEQTNNQ